MMTVAFRTTALLLTLAALFLAGCINPLFFAMTLGSGNLVTNEYDLTGFTEVDASNAFNVVIEQGDDFAVSVTVDDNLLDRLIVEVRGDTLVLGMRPGTYSNATMRAEVTLPELTGLRLSGASSGVLQGISGASTFEAGLSGASSVTGDVNTGDARIELSGASRAVLTGAANDLTAKASGASRLDLAGFPVATATVEVSGASNAVVNVSDDLDATASGASNVEYIGSPTRVHESTSGASSVRQR